MADDLDGLLGELGARAPRRDLDGATAAVMARIAAEPVPGEGVGSAGIAAALVAVALGFAAGATLPGPAHAGMLLDAGQALAPSTLLAGE